MGDIILKELDEGFVQVIRLEEDSAGEVEVEEGDEGGVLHFEIHGLEDCPLSLFVVALAETFIGVSLVPVEIGDVLVQFARLAGDD